MRGVEQPATAPTCVVCWCGTRGLVRGVLCFFRRDFVLPLTGGFLVLVLVLEAF